MPSAVRPRKSRGCGLVAARSHPSPAADEGRGSRLSLSTCTEALLPSRSDLLWGTGSQRHGLFGSGGG
ncbi:hypothetical protein AGIG_G1656 [Arapaima gigas]